KRPTVGHLEAAGLVAQRAGEVASRMSEVTPGKIVTVSFLVSNNSERQDQFLEQLVLPENWHKIAPLEEPFVLAAHEQHRPTCPSFHRPPALARWSWRASVRG